MSFAAKVFPVPFVGVESVSAEAEPVRPDVFESWVQGITRCPTTHVHELNGLWTWLWLPIIR